MRSPRFVLGVLSGAAVLSLAVAGCGSTPEAPAAAPARAANVDAVFATTGTAITYLPDLVPAGARATVTSSTTGPSSTVTLKVSGLVPNRTYGSHAHQKACGPTAADSGAHFQHTKDPVSPSVDPAYANATNEVWLDFTTDAAGAASVTATQAQWAFTDQAAPQSVVVHAKPTATEPGKAGTAGDRAACITVQF
ncbi:hypothetical protein GCM10009836_09810 [Pseudonocardia ailaonensis]|uniref:Superoxide dismutase copper/zinc binding domain-containing protein n=1 Tax=Pseudonocardia ailaonensis TaxID=367279 RepID=A0ABN2MPV7_9PSEU